MGYCSQKAPQFYWEHSPSSQSSRAQMWRERFHPNRKLFLNPHMQSLLFLKGHLARSVSYRLSELAKQLNPDHLQIKCQAVSAPQNNQHKSHHFHFLGHGKILTYQIPSAQLLNGYLQKLIIKLKTKENSVGIQNRHSDSCILFKKSTIPLLPLFLQHAASVTYCSAQIDQGKDIAIVAANKGGIRKKRLGAIRLCSNLDSNWR